MDASFLAGRIEYKNLKMDTSFYVRRNSSAVSLNFPPPHRLGISAGINISRSSRSSFLQSGSDLASGGGGTDEVDAGPPPAKKAAVSKKREKPLLPRAGVQSKLIIKSHDEKPLKEFSLFLPASVPKAILHSRSAIQEFVLSTANTYLSLWEFSSKMDLLELRIPPLYVEQLCDDGHFLTEFLTSSLNQIGNVKCIKQLILPRILMHPLIQLEGILQPLVTSKCSVSHLFIPITCSLRSKDLNSFNFKSFAAFLRKSTLQELTFISQDGIVKEFHERVAAELKGGKKSPVKVNLSEEDLGEPGPDYIADLRETATVGECVDPHLLVSSLNATTGAKSTAGEKSSGARPKSQKSKARGAFSTDCTYCEEAELSSVGPFISEIWNLERLHSDEIDGRGTTIAVVDSGINYTHPAFKGKIVAVKNFVTEDIDNIDCAIDSDGHGTHCAAIAAGNSFYCPLNASNPDSPCIKVPPGVAPGAKLVVCKVVRTSNGDVDSDAFLASLQWLKKQHTSGKLHIDVVSISLASTYYSHERAQVISDLTGLGVIVVCCASNVGRLRMQPIAFPARLGNVLCIGAHDENGKPTSFSPVGRELDFLSPGDNLWGAGPGTVGPFAMDCASGTSCATPAVAGLVCLILQAVAYICERDPEQFQIGGKSLIELVRNVWVMREILKEMSSSPGHHSEEIGYGTLNPYRVLDRSDEELMRIIDEIIEDE